MKKMSPAMKFKLQLILIYLAAIVFCILWLSDEIAINKRIKRDEIYLITVAENASVNLDLYCQSDGNEVYWENSISYMAKFAAVYNSVFGGHMIKKFNKKGSERYSVGDYADNIADLMLTAPDLVKPRIPDIAQAMRSFLDYLNGADAEYAKRAEDGLRKIFEELHAEYYSAPTSD